MGSSQSMQKQNNAILQQLQKDYMVEDHFKAKDNAFIKSLFDRKTGKTYILRIIPTNSTKQSQVLEQQVKHIFNFPYDCISPLHTYYKHTINCFSSNKEVFYLLFALNHFITLQSQIKKRYHQSKFFKEEELIQGFQNIAKALAYLKYQKKTKDVNKENALSHGNINAQNVYYCSGSNAGIFILGNPMISPLPPSDSIEKYPSPERLMQLRNLQVKQYDPYAADLFSAAMTMLQASTLGKMQRVYTKCLINYQTLKLNIRRCPYERVRQLLSQILLGDINSRKHYLQQYSQTNDIFSSRKIKLVSIQKNRSKSRGKSHQKIRLAKSKSNSHLSNSTKIPMINSQTCLVQATTQINIPSKNNKYQINPFKYLQNNSTIKESKATIVKFNYTNKENLNSLQQSSLSVGNNINTQTNYELMKQPFTSNQIYGYISRINIRLNNLQRNLEQTLSDKSNQPLLLQKQKKSTMLSKSMQLARTQKSEDISACQYTINIKSIDHSKIEQLQPQQLDDSFKESIFNESILGRDIDKETDKSKTSESDYIYQASYTINQSKISAGNTSHSRDSFEIRPEHIEDSASYVINMKGTQLEVLSNLIIPQEESSQEESLQASIDSKPKGQYVDQNYQNGGSYKGYMVEGKRHGSGTFVYSEGGTYVGQWKNNRMNGFGKLYYRQDKLAYQGFWYEDSFHGRGKLYNDQIDQVGEQFNYQCYAEIQKFWVSYEGDFAHDCKEGYGKLIFSNGCEYHGQFQKDLPHGKGIIKNTHKEIHGVWNQGHLKKS